MPASGAYSSTLLLGAGLIGLASASFLWVVRDRGRRPDNPSPPDQQYFRHRDIRRFICSALLALIGILMLASTRIDYRVDRAHARAWVWTWLGVLALLIAVLILAGIDWLANSRYAIRHRRELLCEQREILADLARARKDAPLPARGESRRRGGPPFIDPSLN